MATGDVRGQLHALLGALRSIRFPTHTLDQAALLAGCPSQLLPALHYALLRYSKHVAQLAAERGHHVRERRPGALAPRNGGWAAARRQPRSPRRPATPASEPCGEP